MTKKTATAEWNGTLEAGNGSMMYGENNIRKDTYTFDSRFKEGQGIGPEDHIAAAHAGCFSMALSHLLAGEGKAPQRIITSADVSLNEKDEGFAITTIQLSTKVLAPKLSDEELQRYAETAKNNCPVSKALAGAEISLSAALMD
jgi:osmotically inducible protein OsmC